MDLGEALRHYVEGSVEVVMPYAPPGIDGARVNIKLHGGFLRDTPYGNFSTLVVVDAELLDEGTGERAMRLALVETPVLTSESNFVDFVLHEWPRLAERVRQLLQERQDVARDLLALVRSLRALGAKVHICNSDNGAIELGGGDRLWAEIPCAATYKYADSLYVDIAFSGLRELAGLSVGRWWAEEPGVAVVLGGLDNGEATGGALLAVVREVSGRLRGVDGVRFVGQRYDHQLPMFDVLLDAASVRDYIAGALRVVPVIISTVGDVLEGTTAKKLAAKA